MKRMFRERNPIPLGIAVVVSLVLVVAFVGNLNSVMSQFGRKYTAQLTDAGGLTTGAPVIVSGVEVGRVNGIELDDRFVIVEFAVTDSDIELGSETEAEVSVRTVLGDKALVLTSKGDGELADGSVIPVARTVVPYDISEALADVTDEATRLDTGALVQALDAVSGTLEEARPEIRGAVQGVGRVARSLASRDEALGSLLGHADTFTGVLADRSKDLTALVRDGNLILAELVRRRDDLAALLRGVDAMAAELSGAMADHEASLTPTLRSLNTVIDVLRKEKANIDRSLRGLAAYSTSLGEVVASGPFFTASIQNLFPGNLLPPTLGGPR